MQEYQVVAEFSIDGAAWEPYVAHVRSGRPSLPSEDDLAITIERDVLNALGRAAPFVVVRNVRVHRLATVVPEADPARP